jgi:imidazolonepropionase-like amidohydrolase
MRRFIFFCVIAGLCLAPNLVSAQERPIAIVHVRMIDGRGGAAVEDATIILRGNTIEYAGPARDAKVPADAQVIAGGGRTALPGLADLHVHLQGAWDGISVDLLGYQRYFNALLYAGVTTVLDTGNYQPWVLQLRQEQAAGRLRAPRIYCVGAMLDATDPAWPDLGYALTSRYQIPAFVARDKLAKVDMIKAYANLSDRMLRRLAEEAAKEGLRIVVDQWDRNGSPDLVGTGIAGFAHAPTRKMSNEDIQFFHDKGLFDISTLVVHESFARTRFADTRFLREPLLTDTEPPWFLSETEEFAKKPQTDEEKKATKAAVEEFEESSRSVKKLWDAGVLLAAGTDAPYPGVFQGESLHHELELLVGAGLTPLQAIQSATYNAARILKAEKEWGSLQAGLRATLVLVAGQPDKNISDTRKVEMVIQDGRILDRMALKFDAKRDPGYRVVPGTFVP